MVRRQFYIRRIPRWRLVAAVALLVALAGLAAVFAIQQAGLAPRLVAIYAERRSSGHSTTIEAAGRKIVAALLWLDRGSQSSLPALPSWFGARVADLAHTTPTTAVSSADELRGALARATPGATILILPGTYRIAGSSLAAAGEGRNGAPITVRAPRLGDVTLEFATLEGFKVSGSYWVFENLVIRGVCEQHSDCEHAFHVVGAAQGVVIRNNHLRDFNAQIKINGEDGRFPDAGRITGNTITNDSARQTDQPVTPIDMVAVSDWIIEDNLIADFVKAGGDSTSYGAFAKGAGKGNQFLHNVVLCEHRLRGSPGRRVGLSFGGGGSDALVCRDQRCDVEHAGGVIGGNLIASCSDVGIYVNRSVAARLTHNTLIDTAGISVRYALASAIAEGNLIDGSMETRDGARIDDFGNVTTMLASLYVGYHPVRNLFRDASSLDFRWRKAPPRRDGATEQLRDLCGTPRAKPPAYGALEDFEACRTSR